MEVSLCLAVQQDAFYTEDQDRHTELSVKSKYNIALWNLKLLSEITNVYSSSSVLIRIKIK